MYGEDEREKNKKRKLQDEDFKRVTYKNKEQKAYFEKIQKRISTIRARLEKLDKKKIRERDRKQVKCLKGTLKVLEESTNSLTI